MTLVVDQFANVHIGNFLLVWGWVKYCFNHEYELWNYILNSVHRDKSPGATAASAKQSHTCSNILHSTRNICTDQCVPKTAHTFMCKNHASGVFMMEWTCGKSKVYELRMPIYPKRHAVCMCTGCTQPYYTWAGRCSMRTKWLRNSIVWSKILHMLAIFGWRSQPRNIGVGWKQTSCNDCIYRIVCQVLVHFGKTIEQRG